MDGSFNSSDLTKESKRQKLDFSESKPSNIRSSIMTKAVECVFCHSFRITENTGPMQHFDKDGNSVSGEDAYRPRILHAHKKCIDWTPRVYYEGEKLKNLRTEIVRASKLKCSHCDKKGAALGCYYNICPRTYHVPCAVDIPGCRWDPNYVMLCPLHTNQKLPSDVEKPEQEHEVNSPAQAQVGNSALPEDLNSGRYQASNVASSGSSDHWVLCGSALSEVEKGLLRDLANLIDAAILEAWGPSITHVVAATDIHGACSRTFKVLMATLGGKWVVSIDWVRACLEAKQLVKEEPYEVRLDIHGCKDGPKTGRLKAMHEGPDIFAGLTFYFSGQFPPSRENSLLQLVRAAGGTILDKDSFLSTKKTLSPSPGHCFVVYSADPPWEEEEEANGRFKLEHNPVAAVEGRRRAAEDVAAKNKSMAVAYTRILEAIAASDRFRLFHGA